MRTRQLLMLRSIPACAGEPTVGGHLFADLGVHPRVCGGASVADRLPLDLEGPSPRVRGSLPSLLSGVLDGGSIPACAGEPTGIRCDLDPVQVHPRVCGGAHDSRADRQRRLGPSPRVRGSPVHDTERKAQDGSIPACAGEPPSPRAPGSGTPVHPRVCGGAAVAWFLLPLGKGPSPRVRGSPTCRYHVPFKSRVHPRVCGGASTTTMKALAGMGPSPRVRGSLPAR